MITAKNLMFSNPIVCKRWHSLKDIMKIMNKNKISYVIVVDENNSLLGILSRWNIARFILKFNISKENLENIPVNNIMQINPASVDVNSSIYEIIESMIETNSECLICSEIENKEKAKVKGIICKRDVLEGIYRIMEDENIRKFVNENVDVKEIMNKCIEKCNINENVIEVKRRMAEKNIKHIMVVENENFVNVISYKDIIDLEENLKIYEILEIKKVKNLIKFNENADLSEIIDTMINKHIGIIPIVDNDSIIGLIGRKEIFLGFLCAMDKYKNEYKRDFDIEEFYLHSNVAQKTKSQVKKRSKNFIIIPRFAYDIIPEKQKNGEILCCKPYENVGDVGKFMETRDISHIIVTDDGTTDGAFFGVISKRDITIYRRILNVEKDDINATPIIRF
ncbi:MAG: CBS domain-containing protein, partial [Candidatus Altarchaeaceae archaeon]